MPKRKQEGDALARERRRVTVSELYLKGRTLAAIGLELGVSATTVAEDLKVVREEWSKAAMANLAKAKAEQLAKVDTLERTYWDAWEASKKEREVRMAKRVQGGKDGDREETSVRREQLLGDPRYLEGVRWCIAERGKILGTYAPEAVDVNHRGEVEVLERLSDEALGQLIAAAEARSSG